MGILFHGVTIFSCQGVRVSEGGMLIKVVHRLFVRGILWVVQTSDVSLVLFYIPRHVVCCDCNGIGWIATRLVWLYDRMILLRKFSVICLCPPIVSDPVGWRLKYTEVQSQWMAFTQSPSLSNSPKILNNYLIFFIFTVQRLWIFVVCSVIETTFIGERGFRFIRSGMPIGNGPLSISSTLA